MTTLTPSATSPPIEPAKGRQRKSGRGWRQGQAIQAGEERQGDDDDARRRSPEFVDNGGGWRAGGQRWVHRCPP